MWVITGWNVGAGLGRHSCEMRVCPVVDMRWSGAWGGIWVAGIHSIYFAQCVPCRVSGGSGKGAGAPGSPW